MRLAASLALVVLSACQCDAPLDIPDGCSPLLYDVDCGLPYPSDFFLVKDASLPSGKRVKIPKQAKMIAETGESADVTEAWAPDGFSRVTPVVFTFGQRVAPDSAPGVFDDPKETTQKGFHTALIEAKSGRRVPHWIDVDPRAEKDTREALILHPYVQLEEKTRYVVAISGLKAKKGELSVPEAFRRLRDGVADDGLADLQQRYDDDIFPVIEEAGIARADLQLAWDFTTGSDERAMQDMLDARIATLEWLEHNEPGIEITSVFEGASLVNFFDGEHPELTWRFVKGFITGPLLTEEDDAGALLARDADGKPTVVGTARFPFSAVIPASVRDGDGPARALAYGHGFFGDRTEVESTPLRHIFDEARVVAFGIDWEGMSADDIGFVVQAVGGEVYKSIEFGDRVIQGMMNWQTLTHAVRAGLFSRAPAFQRPNPKGERTPRGGLDVIDAGQPLAFLGISQGHVLGGTLAALDADIDRNVLQVGGAGFTTMMFRARPFNQFLFLLNISLPDFMDQQKLAAQMQTQFDRFDPATFAPYVVRAPLPRGPDNGFARRRVLVQMGIGDSQVPNVGSELHVRLLGIPQLKPSPLPAVYGIPQRDAPIEGSAWAVYDLGVDDGFYQDAAPAPEGNIVHEGVRRTPEAVEQIRAFVQDGVVENACDGACVIDLGDIDVPTG